MITAWLKWRLAAYHIINTAPDSIGADSVGASGPTKWTNLSKKCQNGVGCSHWKTRHRLPVRTLPCQRLWTVAVQMLGRKKVRLFKLAGKVNTHG